jgi:uracil-DNA glycosylase family 4
MDKLLLEKIKLHAETRLLHIEEVFGTGSLYGFQSLLCVLSDGDFPNDFMVIGRDLGEQEIIKGVPLIGPAGSLFRRCEQHLLSIKKLEKPIFKTNLVPFKPIGNLAFPPNVRLFFRPILKELIELVKPKVIFTLGKESFFDLSGISRPVLDCVRSKEHFVLKDSLKIDAIIKLVPCVHPSYLIRRGKISIETLEVGQLLFDKIQEGVEWKNVNYPKIIEEKG